MRRTAPWLAIAALASGCPHNVTSDFPLSVGYEPLEDCTALDPPQTAPGYPETLGDPVTGGSENQFSWSHRRGYLLHPVGDVWEVLRTCPCVSRIHTNSPFSPSDASFGVEDFPLSFDIAVRQDTGTIIGYVHWNHRYRGGPEPVTGGPDPPVAYGVRFQKIFGIANIRVQSGSVEIAEVDPAQPGMTELAFVAWLNADESGPADADGAITDWYGELKNALENGCGTCPSF